MGLEKRVLLDKSILDCFLYTNWQLVNQLTKNALKNNIDHKSDTKC